MFYLTLKENFIYHFFENCHFGTPTDFEKFGTDGIGAKNYKYVPNTIFDFLPYTAEIRLKIIQVLQSNNSSKS